MGCGLRIGLLIAVTLNPLEVLAQAGSSAALIADLDQRPASSVPYQFVSAGDEVFFAAASHRFQSELWRTDGSTEGTFRLATGVDSDFGLLRSPKGRRILFSVTDEKGTWLRASDGSAAGSYPLAPVRPYFGAPLAEAQDGVAYFVADDGVHGAEVWRTDGTAAGTGMIRDLAAGQASGVIPGSWPVLFRNQILFWGSTSGDDSAGWSLWRSDGTAEGTIPLVDQLASPFRLSPGSAAWIAGEFAYFATDGVAGQGLWRTDGTPEGTIRLSSHHPARRPSWPSVVPAALGDVLLFFASGGGLWRSDGTSEGTFEVKSQLEATDAAVFQGRLYFAGCSNGSECGLWASDGTDAGTERLAEVAVSESFCPACSDYCEPIRPHLTVAGGYLYFFAQPFPSGYELWRSDGTSFGTTRLATDLAYAGPAAAVRDQLVFDADNGVDGYELWVSDGSSGGTRLLRDLRPGTEGGTGMLTRAGERLFFTAPDEGCGERLGVVDPASGAVTPVLQINTFQLFGGSVRSHASFRESLFFEFRGPERPDGIYVSDGTQEGTKLLHAAAQRFDERGGVWTTSDRVFFLDAGVLWQLDHNRDEAHAILPTVGRVTDLLELGERVLVATEESRVWTIRPDSPQAHEIPAPGLKGLVPRSLTPIGSGAVFMSTADDAATLWVIDGSLSNARPVGIVPRAIDTVPRDFVASEDGVFFINTDPLAGRELWHWNRHTGEVGLVRDLNPGASDGVERVIGWSRRVVFVGDDGSTGLELWSSDGSAGETRLVKDIRPGAGSGLSDRSALTLVDEVLLFGANDGESGMELWRSDGTESGTFQVEDISPGPSGSEPTSFSGGGRYVTFLADDGFHGREPWRITADAVGGRCVGDCNHDFEVTVDELLGGVSIGIGAAPTSRCDWADGDFNGSVEVNEIVLAIDRALDLCR